MAHNNSRLTLLAFPVLDFCRRSFHTWAAAVSKWWLWFNASGLMNSSTNLRIVYRKQLLAC